MNKTDINIAFGRHLAAIRKAQGFSQEAFAYKCGIDRTYIGILERGEKSPTLNTLAKIAKSFNLSLSELLNGIEDNTQN